MEGNMDQLLIDSGVPWHLRRVAKGMNYGVGKAFVTISQDADAVEIINGVPGGRPIATGFVVGGRGWQETSGQAGTLFVKASWDGSALVMEQKTWAGKVFPATRRWVDPRSGDLVVSARTSRGEEVLRIHASQ